MFPCITYTRPLGSLRETGMNLGRIWKAAGTARVQSEIWEGRCPQCWTACEAYQSILGNLARPWDRTPQPHWPESDGHGALIPIERPGAAAVSAGPPDVEPAITARQS